MDRELVTLVELLAAEGLIVDTYRDIREIAPLYISDNSKDVERDTLFICKGSAFRKQYLYEAVSCGACAYLSETKYTDDVPWIIVSDIRRAMAVAARWFYGYPGDELVKIGVTGTKGKTSCVSILSDILKSNALKTSVFTTHHICIGNEEYESILTTPEPITLQRYFRQSVDCGSSHVAMEISSQAMKMNRVYGEHYKVGIFLNIEEDHIGPLEHQSMEEYLSCKLSLFGQCGTVIINRETNMFDRVYESVPEGRKVILFGYDNHSTHKPDAVIRSVVLQDGGLSFELCYQGFKYELSSNLMGLFNVDNITAAVLAAIEIGVPWNVIKNTVTDVFIPGRFNQLDVAGRHVFIDYAHNHLSYEQLFREVRKLYPKENITALIGAAGEKAVHRRKEAGRTADKYADRIVITEQDSAGEPTEQIGKEIAFHVHKPCSIITRREDAIYYILDNSCPGDVLVLTGKGAEKTLRTDREHVRPYKGDYQVVKEWETYFGDKIKTV